MEQGQPKSIGQYEVLSVIGSGGMGVVYLAHDPMMVREVAIKTVTHNLSSDAAMLQRFYREAEKMGRLHHINIITVYHLGEHDGFPYIVMEYVEGKPLDKLISAAAPIPVFDGLRIIEQICEALAYAHKHDVVHRDVKPANVIVRPDHVAKLLDFGIATQERTSAEAGITETGGVIGTVPYMAPERLRGARFDGRSDIFSTGVLMFQVLTGRLPFPGKEYVLINQILNERHPPLSQFIHDYPAELDHILDKALAKDPLQRYQSADEMGAELYSVIEDLKGEYSLGILNLARDLASKDDFIGAKNALTPLLDLDPKNTSAKAMSKELDLRISTKARATQANRLQLEAKDALREKKFDLAIQLLEQAIHFQPDNFEIADLIKATREKKRTSEQIHGYLVQAEQAKRVGDITGARAIVEKALQLDTSNSRLRAAYLALVRQAEEAALQAKLDAVIQNCRGAMARRDYQTVLDLVERTLQAHPDSPDLHELADSARDGLIQEERRQLIAEVDECVRGAVTEEETQQAARLLRQSLQRFPADATLLRYQAEIEIALRQHQARHLVDQTLKQCVTAFKTAPHETLEKVRQTLSQVPGDERLIALEARIEAHLHQLELEAERSRVLTEANASLERRDFARAVSVLQRCQPPVSTPEIRALLAFAIDQSRNEEQQQLVVRAYTEAQALLRDKKFKECIALVSPIVTTTSDSKLVSILELAQRELNQRTAELERALNQLTQFMESNCYEQVLSFIASLPPHCASAPEVAAIHEDARTRWLREQTFLNSLGRAYAALDAKQSEQVAATLEISEESAQFDRIYARFSDRRTIYADDALTSQIRVLQSGSAEISALPEMAATDKLRRFASDPVGSEWNALMAKLNRGKQKNTLMSRFRSKSS